MQMSKEVHILKLDDILPNRFQPRIVFDEKAITELTNSIKEYGVIEPIIVRKVADKYEIIAGERRYKASVLAGKETIPAIITELNDKDSAEIALIENVQRQNLTPIEEAVSYKKILDMGYMNQTELADKLGKTQSTVANKLRLLNLTDNVQEALLQERISERHARSLLRLPNDKQDAMLERIVAERMTVRKTDEEINKILNGDAAKEETVMSKEIEEKKEEKEEISMNNNDVMNQFNIPNAPIIQPTQEAPTVAPVEPAMPQQPEPVAPVQVAQPAVQEVAAPQVQTINNEPATEENQDTPISGRFFNMFGEQPQEESSASEDGGVASTIPTAPVEPTPVQPTGFDFNPFGPVQEPQPVVTPVTPVEPVMPTIPAAPVMPEVTPQPVMQDPIPMPNIPVTQDMMAPVQPMPEAINPMQAFQLNDNQEFTNASVVEMGSMGNNRIEEPTLEPLMETSGPVQKVEMKEIINMIRNCADQIEKSGYTIDTDELDFDDSYQVIFKISKND